MSEACVPFVRLDVTGVDDPEAKLGIVLYVAGCSRRCPGCHNRDLQLSRNHTFVPTGTVVNYIDRYLKDKKASELIECVVFQGGDWMEYPEAYSDLASIVKVRGYRTVLYTGEYYENLAESVREMSDWVIDGPWEEDKVSVFPPSSNQRVFRHGQLVDPEELPLYKHLLESRGDG